MVQLARVRPLAVRRDNRVQLLAGHHSCGDLGDWRADGFCHERHGARGARVYFEDIDRAVLDCELHVHQALDVQRQRQRAGLYL